MKNEQLIVTRSQIGQWGSFIGGFALLIGILGLIWQGGLTTPIIVILAIGACGIGLWVLMTPDEFIGFVTGRTMRYGTTAVFSTLLLIGIVVLGYMILERAVITVDMTEGQRFTLSKETDAVLQRIQQDIRITGFYPPAELAQREVDDQFFRLYEVASGGRITRLYVDPEEQPGIAERFTQRFGVINTPYNVFISFVNSDGTIDFDTTLAVPRSSAQERDMTEAISRLLLTGVFNVYFETGHGAYQITDSSSVGISLIHNGIQANGVTTLPLDLAALAETGGQIPDSASVVILPRLVTPLSAEEISIIDDYLKRGGALFVMTDPLFSDSPFLAQNSLFNQYLWDNFGLRALDAVVVDPTASGQTPLDVISYQVFTNSDIGANLNIADEPDSVTQFRLARPIEVNTEPSVSNGHIIMTSPESYGETDLKSLRETDTYSFDQNQDIAGPLTTVAWANDLQTGSQVLIVGDGDFITNGQVLTPLGNGTLFSDGLDWLTGSNEQVGFDPQIYTTGLPVMFIDGQTLDVIAFLTVILLPGLVLVTGLGIWLRRMRR